ncbi:MAG: hypothetical protein J6U95_02680 [Alistipes sp.]|nr:hypothetical protein [Alistipes sp.]
MKRYLYILLVVILAVVACEPTPTPIPKPEPEVAFHFGTVGVETTESTATITVAEPYITVDGVKYEDTKISLRYIGLGHDLMNYVEEYSVEGSDLIFEVDDLLPNTNYEAYITLDGGEYGVGESEKISFTTQKLHEKQVSMVCSAEVDAKGLMATVNLSDIAYLVDGESEQIHVVKVEYSPANPEQWIAYEFNGARIVNGEIAVELPFNGEEYLIENRDYQLRVTLYPLSGDYEPLTSQVIEFKTLYAEVTANIATPSLELDYSYISASVEDIEIFYDGVAAHNYKASHPVEYYFYYREVGVEEWSRVGVSATHGDISATLPAEEGSTYEVKAVVVAGAELTVCESEVAEIVVPKHETPTPPTPPVEGGDTSSIAGTWHLTQWRGAEPSFDVYLDITEEGVVTLWQKIEHREWECYFSSAAIENGIISGVYSDGVAWGTSYYVTVAESSMTWVDVNDATDISVYTRAELPEGLTTVATRSVVSNVRFL